MKSKKEKGVLSANQSLITAFLTRPSSAARATPCLRKPAPPPPDTKIIAVHSDDEFPSIVRKEPKDETQGQDQHTSQHLQPASASSRSNTAKEAHPALDELSRVSPQKRRHGCTTKVLPGPIESSNPAPAASTSTASASTSNTKPLISIPISTSISKSGSTKRPRRRGQPTEDDPFGDDAHSDFELEPSESCRTKTSTRSKKARKSARRADADVDSKAGMARETRWTRSGTSFAGTRIECMGMTVVAPPSISDALVSLSAGTPPSKAVCMAQQRKEEVYEEEKKSASRPLMKKLRQGCSEGKVVHDEQKLAPLNMAIGPGTAVSDQRLGVTTTHPIAALPGEEEGDAKGREGEGEREEADEPDNDADADEVPTSSTSLSCDDPTLSQLSQTTHTAIKATKSLLATHFASFHASIAHLPPPRVVRYEVDVVRGVGEVCVSWDEEGREEVETQQKMKQEESDVEVKVKVKEEPLEPGLPSTQEGDLQSERDAVGQAGASQEERLTPRKVSRRERLVGAGGC